MLNDRSAFVYNKLAVMKSLAWFVTAETCDHTDSIIDDGKMYVDLDVLCGNKRKLEKLSLIRVRLTTLLCNRKKSQRSVTHDFLRYINIFTYLLTHHTSWTLTIELDRCPSHSIQASCGHGPHTHMRKKSV